MSDAKSDSPLPAAAQPSDPPAGELPVQPAPAPQPRLGLILLVTLPIGIAAFAGAIAWGYFQVGERISEWLEPPLVSVTGRVYLNGEPLDGGEIFARSLDRDGCNALGRIDAEGNFTLRTDVRGDFVAGVRVGTHRVIIIKADPAVPLGLNKTVTLTPPECADFDNSPLRLKVVRDPAENKAEFRLEYKKKSP